MKPEAGNRQERRQMTITARIFGDGAKNATSSEGDVGGSAESKEKIRKNQMEKETRETNQVLETRLEDHREDRVNQWRLLTLLNFLPSLELEFEMAVPAPETAHS